MRPADAAEAMLLGNRMTGADAARMGLVNRAVPADEMDDVVDGFVADLLAGGPDALAATKRLLTRVPGMSTEEAFTWTAELSAELFKSDEAHEGMRAFYRPSTDTVTMPPTGLFDAPEAYYSTLFHELGHSTGHTSRLNRKGVAETALFGSFTYGQEELVAEMTSAFLCSHCHISQPVIDNQAAYIGSWVKTIKSDIKLAVVAAAQAQKAADFILANGGTGHETAL